jgi:hypothetical protein
MDGWKEDVQNLTSWLYWSVWIKCRPVCGPEVGQKECLYEPMAKSSTSMKRAISLLDLLMPLLTTQTSQGQIISLLRSLP